MLCGRIYAFHFRYLTCLLDRGHIIHARLLHGYFLVSFFNYRFYEFKFVIYRVKSIQLFALLFYDEGDWPTEFQIGTPRPE